MGNSSIEIKEGNQSGLFDLSINMKGYSKEYFLVIQHLLNQSINKNQKEGGMLGQQDEFQITNSPLFELNELFVNEIRSKIKPDWKGGVAK